MSFKKLKYTVIKEAISKDLATYIYNYFLMKQQVYDTCIDFRYMSPYETMCGFYEGQDDQIPNTFSMYADPAMDTLLLKCQPIVEKTTQLKLYPGYTYARRYKKGDVLKRHKDRPSCQISTTLHLGGDMWPIFIDPTGGDNIPTGNQVDLKIGDMLVYSGCDLEHWRDAFEGNVCVQTFLHYNDANGRFGKENIFDKRPMLGIPK